MYKLTLRDEGTVNEQDVRPAKFLLKLYNLYSIYYIGINL